MRIGKQCVLNVLVKYLLRLNSLDPDPKVVTADDEVKARARAHFC